MRTSTESKAGKAALMMGFIAGAVDLVALPIWVGTLMQHYGFEAERAGLTVTLFMLSVVPSSLFFAARFDRLHRRPTAAAGFAFAALMFLGAAALPVNPGSFAPLAALLAAAGLGVGCGLSITHGTMGRSKNPHATFAVAGIVIGVFGVCFFGVMPAVLQDAPATLLFVVFAAMMAMAAAAALLAFPEVAGEASVGSRNGAERVPIGAPSWLAMAVVVCMTLNQSMVFAFLERAGISRDFGTDRVHGVLLAVGLVNLTPSLLAALLQKRISPQRVGLLAPIVQAALASVIMSSTAFIPYALAASIYTGVIIFTQPFLFGLISRLDPTGRAVAATPALMMLGSALGPALAGVIVHASGYAGIPWACIGAALVAAASMLGVIRGPLRSSAATLPNAID